MRSKKSFLYLSILTLFLTLNLISCGGGGGAEEGERLARTKKLLPFLSLLATTRN
jgi:hypothetical protein